MGHSVVNRSNVQKMYDVAEKRLERCAVFLVGQLRQNLSTAAQFSEARIAAYSTRSRKVRKARAATAKRKEKTAERQMSAAARNMVRRTGWKRK